MTLMLCRLVGSKQNKTPWSIRKKCISNKKKTQIGLCLACDYQLPGEQGEAVSLSEISFVPSSVKYRYMFMEYFDFFLLLLS